MAHFARVIAPGYPRHVTLRGHLWQGRLASFVLGDDWLLEAARYIERNPLKAGPGGASEGVAVEQARGRTWRAAATPW